LSEFGHYATDDEKYPGEIITFELRKIRTKKKDDVVRPNNTDYENERR
jgi:hypothetical protein